MTINQKPPQSPRGSLIERAAQTYGLRDILMREPGVPVVSDPEADAWAARPQLPPFVQDVSPAAPAPVQAAPVQAPIVASPPVAHTPFMAPEMPVAPVIVPAPEPVIHQEVPVSPYVSPPVFAQRRGVDATVDQVALKESGFIVPGSPPTMLSEEFRMIKRQVLLQAFGNQGVAPLDKGRQILVCSAQPNEGKSFCSVNLALSMVSETDLEVLLIDADVAKPEVLSLLGLPAGPGLMDALADPTLDPESLIMHTSIPGLSILPAGRQSNNDTELLASARTRGLVDGLAAANPRRIVIFDSAPALAASPASVLALHVGQIVLVVRADVTTESELREALSMLDGGARIQLLINDVTFSGSNRKFGYYYGLGEK